MDEQTDREQRVTPLELFFDLVFVFAITQVTGFLADNSTWLGLLRGLMLLAALWWAWASYAWLTNTLNPEEGPVRLAVFGSIGQRLLPRFEPSIRARCVEPAGDGADGALRLVRQVLGGISESVR